MSDAREVPRRIVDHTRETGASDDSDNKRPKHMTIFDDAGDYYGDEHYDDPRDWDEEDGDYEDCGLMPDGQCLKVGSEECDWECPNRMSEDFAGSPAWLKKHKRAEP